jgi:hypothetical protein
MIPSTPDDEAINNMRIDAAMAIIEGGSCMISKVPRAGLTTSAIIACGHQGKKLTVIAPTRRILMETVNKAAKGAVRIPGNSECPVLEPDIKKNPILRQLPLALPDCKKCEKAEMCPVLAILRVPDPRVMALTYPKLEALMLSQGNTADEILSKIAESEVVLLDECHELALPKAVSVKVSAILKIPEHYEILVWIYDQWQKFCQNHARTTQELLMRAKQGHASQHLSRSVANIQYLEWQQLKLAWMQLRKLAVSHELPDEEILMLRDIITILSTSQASMGFISEAEGEGGVYVSAGQGRHWRALNEFFSMRVQHAMLMFISGTNFEPWPGYFSLLAWREVRQAIFPDLRDTTKKMTLIPDTWKLTSWNFKEKLPAILDAIKTITEKEKTSIYLLARSSRMETILRKELKRMGLKRIMVDHYRSDRSIGVERHERICIGVGLAEVPANAYDALGRGDDEDECWLDSRRLRICAVDAATYQAINRVKDPKGKVESRVYFIGVRLDQVKRVATWGTNRQVVHKETKTFTSNGVNVRSPVFDVTVSEAIELPRIQGEDKNPRNSERRSVDEFIAKIDKYDVKNINMNSIFSEFDCKVSTNMYRGNAVKLGIYNIPSNESELDLTAKSLYFMFVNRDDCYALQQPEGGYAKYCSPLTVDKIKRHIRGTDMFTMGTYEIGLDDTVTWCLDDIDSHNGETDAWDKVARLVAVCRSHGIPFLLETSGSLDSYHLWIPLGRTRTYNAYRFIRQINAEAKVDCECWPKQKSLRDKHGKYGNLVKLPVCLNLKSGGRSAFLDADTFEPLEGVISYPGRVHLLEIPELSPVTRSEVIPKKTKLDRPACTRTVSSGGLDPCMERALADNIALVGSEGHNLRLAIAIKANTIGMDAEATAQLFQSQKDYDHDFSLKKVQETWCYNYFPMSCTSLRDKCGKLVNPYCRTCHYNRTLVVGVVA